ncbi:MAG: hypothetical protein K2W85_11075 [Phycisphaerales bacterium]|nr:hypothetical protein [Phycisphaerales bacterium]
MRAMRQPIAGVLIVGAMFALVGTAGCAEEEQVTRYKPFFAGMEGAEYSGLKPIVSPREAGGLGAAALDEQAASGIIEHADGRREFITTSVSMLTRHVETLLDENTPAADKELLEQLVDERTKRHYESEGRKPEEYVRWLHKNRKDIAKMLARMPMAERTPTVIVRQPGDNTWVIELTGQATRGVKYTQLWVRQEMGRWRLVHVK